MCLHIDEEAEEVAVTLPSDDRMARLLLDASVLRHEADAGKRPSVACSKECLRLGYLGFTSNLSSWLLTLLDYAHDYESYEEVNDL